MPILDRYITEIVLNNKTIVFDVLKNDTLASILKSRADISWPVKSDARENRCALCKMQTFPILLNGSPVNASYILAKDSNHAVIETLDYLSSDPDMVCIADAFNAYRADRHRYCVPGMELALYALLKDIPSPTREDIRRMLSGNLCACAGRDQIEDAISNVLEIALFLSKIKTF